MTSEIAKTDIEELWAAGLKPSVEDIVRLNAMGLKLEYAHKKAPQDSTEYLPRVAAISETVSFRQPTVAHEIWMDKVERFLKPGDLQSLLAVKAFALSRPASELPDGDSPESFSTAIQGYADTLGEFTRDQIFAAIEYVLFGPSPLVGEHAPSSAKPREVDGTDFEDWKHCVAAGVLHEACVALWGASVAELEQMTREQLRDIIRRAQFYRDFDTEPRIRRAQGEYYDTLEEIRQQLERKAKNG